MSHVVLGQADVGNLGIRRVVKGVTGGVIRVTALIFQLTVGIVATVLLGGEGTHIMVQELHRQPEVNHIVVTVGLDDIYGVPTECSLLYDVIMAFISGDVRPGLYNVRNGTRDGECPSIYDIACFIANEVHGNTLCVEKMKSSDFHTYAPRQTNSMLSIKKLENEFAGTLTGRLPFKHWKDAIKDFIVNRNVVEMAKEAAKVDLGKLAEKFK